MDVRKIKSGALLSYVLIFVDTIYGLVFVPFLISVLGDGEFGVYRIIASFTNSIAILDFGIGGTMLRYIAKFRAENDQKRINNFVGMGLIQAFAFCALISGVSFFMYGTIDSMYSASLSISELEKAKKLFIIATMTLAITPFEKVLSGTLLGHEEYSFSKGLQVMVLLIKMAILVPLLSGFPNSVVLMLMNMIATVVSIVIELCYLLIKCRVNIKVTNWEQAIFVSSVGYTSLTFVQSIAVQFNSNLDNIVIGAVVGSTAVAVYSIGLQLYNMFEHLAMAFSDLMLPTVSKQISAGAERKQLEDTVIKVGRFEFMILGGALCGFIIIGKEFILLWLGENYVWAWYVALILMVPTMVPLIQNVCLSVLRAENRMKFRTVVVCIMAVFNLLITVIGVRYYGPLAACIGTATGLVCANIIAMNIYYVKVVHLNIFRIFKGILSGTWLCCVLAAIALNFLNYVIRGTWFMWIMKVLFFVVVYGIFLVLFGMNFREKQVIFGRLLKRTDKGE